MINLSKQQAQKLIVLCNDFHHNKKHKSVQATLESFNTLGYVQIDTISVVNRAHLHVLWSRNHNFKETHLDSLFDNKDIFEYWSHAAAILPMQDYRYSLIRKQQFSSGESHWHKQDKNTMAKVKAVIQNQGPKKSSDFKNTFNSDYQSKSQWWDWKPTKIALEQLYMQGELMVKKRQGFQKVYDLTDKVLPPKCDNSLPETQDYCRYLVQRYLFAQGVGNAEHIAYLLKGMKVKVQAVLEQMYKDEQLQKIIINQQEYYGLPERLELLNHRLQKKVHLLSPFDNMVIQRKRLKELFDYDYQIECYVPKAKRKFGYFCLPILYGSQLVGRVDCKAHRHTKVLKINAIYQEKPIKNIDDYQIKLRQALSEFAEFNQCEQVVY